MAKISDADKFLTLWLDFRAAAEEIHSNNPALIEASAKELLIVEKLVSASKSLLSEFGEELMAAVLVAQEALEEESSAKNIDVSDFHGKRVKLLRAKHEALDEEIAKHETSIGWLKGDDKQKSLARIAELQHTQRKLGYDLERHEAKFVNRAHGFSFGGMRKRRS